MRIKALYATTLAALSLAACDNNSGQPAAADAPNNTTFCTPTTANVATEKTEAASSAEFSFQTEGSINPKTYKPGETACISFNTFPRNVEEFQKAQEQLGTTPEGAVVLELFAFEIYNHDHTAGEECLKMANTSLNTSSVLSILKDRYNPKYGDYYTPQLVASYLEGATPENAYKANKPFKVTIRSHKSNAYEDANSLKGTVLKLEVYSNGYDTHWRGINVVKSKGETYYKVVNNPATYTQCKPVSFKTEEDYTDIWDQ